VNTRARSAAPANSKAEVVAGNKGREAHEGVDRSAPRCASEYIAWSLLTGVPDSELETIKEKS
jgi:hypothetical protein